jgi:hypothetical protein
MTGRDPSTIFRVLRKGRLSYSKDTAGNRKIDVAELQRVFPVEKLPDPVAFDGGNGAIRAPALARTEAPHGKAEACASWWRPRTRRCATCAPGWTP